jgi:plasmid stabilization system protein ParE
VAHTIVVRTRARIDIRGAFTGVFQTVSPASAAKWHAGILTKIRSLATNPERYPLAYEAVDLGIELREMLYGKRRHVYRILFTIDGQTVNVHRVRHAAQDRLSSDDI